mgnify:CR=1 FL=1
MNSSYSTSDSIENIAAALAAAQAKITNADANATGQAGKGKYKYAKLENIITEVKPHLTEQGISFVQLPTREGNDCGVTTILMHKSGEFIKCTFLMPGSQNLSPQGFGSLLTYARRYSLAALTGIGQEDDDAKQAQDETKKVANIDKQIDAAKAETGEYFVKYNAAMMPNAELIKLINDAAEAADLTGLAIARIGIDDDEFAILNKLPAEKGGAFTDAARKMMKSQGFADVMLAEIAKKEAAA